MKQYCFALDLKDDAELISEYKKYHENVWPGVLESITESGIEKLDIFLVFNRLFMIMITTDDFTLDEKANADAKNKKVQEWETLMWSYQQAIPGTNENEKWQLMEHIFKL